MAETLLLIDDAKADWRLDERTKEVGRRGLADARRALAEAAARRSAATAPAKAA